MNYNYCKRSIFLKAIKRNCINHFVHIFIYPREMWFVTQKAVWSYRYKDYKDILQMKTITQHLRVCYHERKTFEF